VLVADGPDEFRKAVRQEFTAGADHIKIFISGGIAQPSETFDESQMSLEEVKATVEAARAKHSYVCAHSGSPLPIQQAVLGGVKCFEHGYYLDSKTVKAMHEAGCFLVPTLAVTRSPAWMKQHGFEDWTVKKALDAGGDHLDSIKKAVREGVKIANGTDVPPGDKEDGIPIVVKEMEYLTRAGLSNLGSIQASTINAAELLGVSGELGAVEPGFQADLISCQENPLRDVRALAKLILVMQAGQVIREGTA
jgi:imidazolonepropionase-like amidohydrolase